MKPQQSTRKENLLGPCTRCGFRWQARVRKPKNCPRCHSKYWNQERRRQRKRTLSVRELGSHWMQKRARARIKQRNKTLAKRIRQTFKDKAANEDLLQQLARHGLLLKRVKLKKPPPHYAI